MADEEYQIRFRSLADEAAKRLAELIPSAPLDSLKDAITRSALYWTGPGVRLTVGTGLDISNPDGKRLYITALDDGYANIDQEGHSKPFQFAHEPWVRTPMARPIRVHRHLISPPWYTGGPEPREGVRNGDKFTTFCSTVDHIGHVELQAAADLDMKYAAELCTQNVEEITGVSDPAFGSALRDESIAVLADLLADSPANAPGPVRFYTTGARGRAAQCTLRDIQLPFATAKLPNGDAARVGVYKRLPFAETCDDVSVT